MKRSRFLMIALAACCSAMPAFSTTLVRMSLSQLSQASNTIVVGRVVGQECRWNADHTRIMTYTTVALNEAMKGQPPNTMVVQQPGGTVGNRHVVVPGTAVFRQQSQYVLFLENGQPTGTYRIVGMMQGAFRVFEGGIPARLRVVLPTGALRTGVEHQSLSQAPPLEEFHAAVSRIISAPIIVPRGVLIPVVIQSAQFHGAGQLEVTARTSSDLFPNTATVIPAGSTVFGTAIRTAKGWQIHWQSISVRGSEARISGLTEEPADQNFSGHSAVIEVR